MTWMLVDLIALIRSIYNKLWGYKLSYVNEGASIDTAIWLGYQGWAENRNVNQDYSVKPFKDYPLLSEGILLISYRMKREWRKCQFCMAESLTYEAETEEIFMYSACSCARKKETNKQNLSIFFRLWGIVFVCAWFRVCIKCHLNIKYK